MHGVSIHLLEETITVYPPSYTIGARGTHTLYVRDGHFLFIFERRGCLSFKHILYGRRPQCPFVHCRCTEYPSILHRRRSRFICIQTSRMPGVPLHFVEETFPFVHCKCLEYPYVLCRRLSLLPFVPGVPIHFVLGDRCYPRLYIVGALSTLSFLYRRSSLSPFVYCRCPEHPYILY